MHQQLGTPLATWIAGSVAVRSYNAHLAVVQQAHITSRDLGLLDGCCDGRSLQRRIELHVISAGQLSIFVTFRYFVALPLLAVVLNPTNPTHPKLQNRKARIDLAGCSSELLGCKAEWDRASLCLTQERSFKQHHAYENKTLFADGRNRMP